ncbi:hypothetical protein evm_010110 [Chilo suppressalis]|nr:hypothetical protein evm_010110 [Chilo suppressalis]
MEQRPITFNLLHKDELEYEVRIRGAKPVDGVPALKAQVRALNKDLPSDEILTCEVEIESELDIIREKLDSLDDLTSQTSSRASSLKALNRIQSLAHHLFHRLSRLDSDNDDSIASQLEALQERLDKFLVKLDNIMHHFKSSLTQVPPEENSRVHAASERTGNASPDSGAAVHKLNIRFNGKTCVKAFLQRLEELCLSRGVTDGKLFNSAAELFTDEALCWYRGVQSEVHSWLGLKTLLLDEYLPSDYDHRLLQEIRSRTQGSDESIVNYLSIMQNYFTRLSKSLSEEEKLNIVLFNIRPFYTTQLALNPIESWTDLKRKCRLLEGAKERSQHFSEPPKITQACLAPDLSYKNSNNRQLPKVSAVQLVGNDKFCVRCRVEGHTLGTCREAHVLVGRMPFLIVETIENGSKKLSVCPEIWVNNGILSWPTKKNSKKCKMEQKIPKDSWLKIPCIIKRRFDSYEAADAELDVMVELPETENEGNSTVRLPGNEDFNNIAKQLSSTRSANDNNASTTAAQKMQETNNNISSDNCVVVVSDHVPNGNNITVQNNIENEVLQVLDCDDLLQNQKKLAENQVAILDNQKKISKALATISVKIDTLASKFQKQPQMSPPMTVTPLINEIEKSPYNARVAPDNYDFNIFNCFIFVLIYRIVIITSIYDFFL